jgi:hypothetical protein
MNPLKPHPQLNWAEYASPDQNPNAQIAAARSQFMHAVQRVFPRFLQELQKRVYPEYALLVESRQPYWSVGWTFETWQLHSDRDNRLTPLLVGWARAFNAEQTWILEGALHTLWLWHRHPDWRTALDISGFQSNCSGDSLTSDDERLFCFEDPGWDPEFQKWQRYSDSIREQFEQKLTAYEKRVRTLVESRGAIRAHGRFSAVNFEWFVLYQLAKMSATKILRKSTLLRGDESTILKGVKIAATLLGWTPLRKSR